MHCPHVKMYDLTLDMNMYDVCAYVLVLLPPYVTWVSLAGQGGTGHP